VGDEQPDRQPSVDEGAGRILRLFRFRPVRLAFDTIVREVMIPDLLQRDGLEAVIVGRRGPGELGDRLIASVWRDQASMVDAVGASFDRPVFHPEFMDETTDKVLETAPIAFACRSGDEADPQLVRLVTGRIQPGARTAYVTEARAGTLADIEAGRGPSSLYLADLGDDRFATVSLWSDWSNVGEATGGTLRHPEVTRHSTLLVDWQVDHYEVLPGLPIPGRPS
jgi:hypothetical protein